MKLKFFTAVLFSLSFNTCNNSKLSDISDFEKKNISELIQKEIDTLILSVKTKDIDLYMRKMPKDFVIYNENGETISRQQQREFALRDWSIIDTTLSNFMVIDSIEFSSRDSLYVYTFQKWERIMYRQDGITTDTVLTTQKHKEHWKKKNQTWMGYDVVELGGKVYINGKEYDPK